jgi:hypothetical protein
MTKLMDILEDYFIASTNYSYVRLDGSTKMNDRQVAIENFNSTPCCDLFVFLLSTRAGFFYIFILFIYYNNYNFILLLLLFFYILQHRQSLVRKKINIKLNNETILNNFSMTELRAYY